MPSASRLTLPENFYDITSDELLLQPEPQYVFANMWMSAMMTDLGVPDEIGLPGRGISGQGADYVTPESQRLDLNAAREIQAQAFAVKIDFTAAKGTTVRLNRPVYQDTTYTTESRQIASGATISTTPIAPGSEQTDITLFRFAGPYDQANSRVAPYAIEAFDAQMGVHKLTKIIGGNLKRDFHKFLDFVHVLLGEATPTVYPGVFTQDNDITTVGAAKMDYKTISKTERVLDEANIPYFSTGRRLMVLTPQQAEEVKDDAQFARYSQYFKDMNALYPEYLTTVGKFDILKSNTLRKVTNTSSVPVNRGFAFGPGIFGAAMGRPPRVATSTDDNYGETGKVIWLMDGGFKLIDSRFGVSVRTG